MNDRKIKIDEIIQQINRGDHTPIDALGIKICTWCFSVEAPMIKGGYNKSSPNTRCQLPCGAKELLAPTCQLLSSFIGLNTI